VRRIVDSKVYRMFSTIKVYTPKTVEPFSQNTPFSRLATYKGRFPDL